MQERRKTVSPVDYQNFFHRVRLPGRVLHETGKVLKMDKIIIAAGILLIAFAVWQTVQKARGKAKSSCCGTKEVVAAKKVEDTDVSHYPYRYRLSVDGMMCSNCARNVENTLNNMNGVWGKVNLGKKEAEVLTKEAVSEESFAKALKDASYTLKGYTVLADPGNV